MNPPTTETFNPFPGLRPFRPEEEYLFFGRESQVDSMLDTLAATRFLAVVGTSGSGKSSLVNCGLLPALRRGLMAQAGTAWRIATFRPGRDPLRAMTGALAKEGVLFSGADSEAFPRTEIVAATLQMSRLGLADLYQLARLGDDINLLVVVDQFEELFRYREVGTSNHQRRDGVSEEAVAFVNLLLAARGATGRVYVVLTMRSDFLGDCAQFSHLPEAINQGLYLVPRMTREQRRSAICGPAAVAGGEIDPVLLTRLLNDAGEDPDQLSILQHALNRTWAEAGGSGQLNLGHYETIKTMAGALDEHADEAYRTLRPELQKTCEKIFRALTDKATDPRGIRRPATLESLCLVTGAEEQAVIEVIDHFRDPSRSFLTPAKDQRQRLGPDDVIDISHESLMRVWKKLRQWADAEAESAQIYRRLAQTAGMHAAGKTDLLPDPELQMMLDWRRREQPSPAWAERYAPAFNETVAFLDRSRAKRDAEVATRERRRRRELLIARALTVVVIAVLTSAGVLLGVPAVSYWRAQQGLASRLGWEPIDARTIGAIQLGCVQGDQECEDEPSHTFAPGAPFAIMAEEVTNAQFDAFLDVVSTNRIARLKTTIDVATIATRRGDPASRDPQLPATSVTWFEADAFCNFVGGRLPTEDEWEYAARNGQPGRVYPWGADAAEQRANVRPDEGDRLPLPVNSFDRYGGLRNMVGNVAEWTSGFRNDPARPEDHRSGGKRTVRGGSYRQYAADSRLSSRGLALEPWEYDAMVGFRCNRSTE